MDSNAEDRLRESARKILVHARGGDWEHTVRAVDYGKYLLEHEEGLPEIVIPALYLHDIGWSRVDFSDFKQATPANKDFAPSVEQHMQYGSEMAAEILDQLGFDPVLRERIVRIIKVHDDPDVLSYTEDPSAILVVEADRLDRYGLEGLERYKRIFGRDYLAGDILEEAITTRLAGLKTWFRTPTAVALAEKLIREMGWMG